MSANAVDQASRTAFPTGDTTGAADTGAINNLLAGAPAGTVNTLAGGATYFLNGPILVPTHIRFDCGTARIQPAVGFAGISECVLNGNYAEVWGGRWYGGTNTYSANPAADVFSVAAGVIRWRILWPTTEYNNGAPFNIVVTGASHGEIDGVMGTNNAGGLWISAAAGQAAQIAIGKVDLQSSMTGNALQLVNVQDVALDQMNASVLGTAGVETAVILGSCQSCFLGKLDLGVAGAPTAGVGVLRIGASGGNSPSEIDISGGVLQGGGIGALINDAATRLRIRSIMAKKNLTDGWQVNSSGSAILLDGCGGNLNNQSAGTGYDVNVVSAAHVGIFGFCYASSTCTARLNVTLAGNHVTDSNPTSPGGLGTAGNAPAGW